jgi:PBP1b-binding outer membrane lipoprotein LpoB
MKRIIIILVLSLIVIGCAVEPELEQEQVYNVKYTVNGLASIATIIYTNETQGLTQLDDEVLPWEHTLVLKENEVCSIGAITWDLDNVVDITVSVYVDNKLMDSTYTNMPYNSITAIYTLY